MNAMPSDKNIIWTLLLSLWPFFIDPKAIRKEILITLGVKQVHEDLLNLINESIELDCLENPKTKLQQRMYTRNTDRIIGKMKNLRFIIPTSEERRSPDFKEQWKHFLPALEKLLESAKAQGIWFRTVINDPAYRALLHAWPMYLSVSTKMQEIAQKKLKEQLELERRELLGKALAGELDDIPPTLKPREKRTLGRIFTDYRKLGARKE